jgi:hypothetical protein
MSGLLRLYVYWSVLWGLLANSIIGLQRPLAIALPAIDLLTMIACTIYLTTTISRIKEKHTQITIIFSIIFILALIFWNATLTFLHKGDLFTSNLYIAALLRPLLLLLAAILFAQTHSTPSVKRSQQTTTRDLLILNAVQLLVATIQIVNPDIGVLFLASLHDFQSSNWVLAQGDVSGTFPNSIDLAYFIVASYVGLSAKRYSEIRPPSITLSIIVLFFAYKSGSLTAFLCAAGIASYLYLRSLSKLERTSSIIIISFAAALFLSVQWNLVSALAIDKTADMMLSRLGLIFISIPSTLENSPSTMLFGLGADFAVVVKFLRSLPETPLAINSVNAEYLVNDVFWVAMFFSLGIPLTITYLLLFWRLLSTYIGTTTISHTNGGLAKTLFLCIIFAGFFNQILLVRSFAAPLILALLPLALHHTKSQRQNK